ncbi:DJ-1/PfpI family protein [Prauserella shujinwangii]|uniref:DJ-1/PfpI family protein n=1 Tax=Prauserella shujinwangii TaxID=1453103 RepID=A0A2T0M3M3_9PSEU|nr:DJ-1/PfpI family protein [Prauserella shujinwangii]PRX51354.1 DJ-1/PfpI family protein [Prauserella shujinwangii]
MTKTIAFVLYPGLTPLDLVGPLQALTVLSQLRPGFATMVVGQTLDPVATDTPLRVAADRSFEEVPEPDVLLVPGGLVPTIRALTDQRLLDYLRHAGGRAEQVTSVCTGSLLLGAAGLLEGRQATTHWAFLDALAAFGATPRRRRWAADGNVITAAGVSAGLDMALHLITRLADEDAARQVQFAIEYDPEPPLGGLSWPDAPRSLWDPLREETLRQGLADAPDLRERLLSAMR